MRINSRAYFIVLLSILFVISGGYTASIKRTSRKFAEKTVRYQVDGYKHLAYIGIFNRYCANLLYEYKAKSGSRKKVRSVKKEIHLLQKEQLDGKNPFHVVENIIHEHESESDNTDETKASVKMKKKLWYDIDLAGLSKCEFDENTIALTQACYHNFPSGQERDSSKKDLVLISIGGRRTGMTKVLNLGREIHAILEEHFNLYSLTVEAKMFSRDEQYIKWRIANTLKAVIDTLQILNPHEKPKIVLGGYSYGGSHLIKSINQIFTRASFAPYKPDLLLFVDPDGALNTLEHLHLVPEAKRIVNFRGVYIVPQPKLRFWGRLISNTLDEYPSIEGTQPLVLLQKANYQEIVIYQPNRLDLSPHNRVPFDLVDYHDENGNATYLEMIQAELEKLVE